MADKKISQLTSLAPALSTDELPINRSNASGKLTVADVVAEEAATRASKDGDLTTLTTTANSNLVSAINEVNSGLATKIPTSYLDTDTSLTANSDSKIATQKATRAYVLANVTPSATETVQGKAEIATQAETNTGTDDTRFVTPLKLKTNLATYGYLTGSGTTRSLPLYSSGAVLGDSSIKQSTTGTRILINGITDDTATALQVSGSIRQTDVTSKIAAFDADGKLVDGGSGYINYIPRFSTVSLLSNSTIRDDGTTVGIQTAPNSTNTVRIVGSTSTIDTSLYVVNSSFNATTTYGISTLNGTIKTEPNIGIRASAANSTTANTGVVGVATTGSSLGINVGGSFTASGGASNYALQLIDGTQTVAGRFLKNITTDGKANWASITTADITSGLSGTDTYVPRWTGTNTLVAGALRDNNTGSIGLGNLPISSSKLYVVTNSTVYGVNASNISTTGITYGLVATSSGIKSSQNIGASGLATNSSTENTGIQGTATTATAGKNVGGAFIATLGATNYSVQLKDGTEAVGKVLQCMDSNGYANWVSHYIVNNYLVNTAFNDENITINFDLGNYVILDYSSAIVTATSTNAVTFTNMKQGRIYKIKVKQGPSPAGQTYTPTFAGMKWPGGTAFTPTVGTGKIDFIEVWNDGYNFFGDFIKNYV